MKVCIVGAGAIGGFIGARLAASKVCALSVVARGATLAALRTHGFRLRQGSEVIGGAVTASDNAAQLGEQDLVVIAVKGPAMPAVAASIGPLLGRDTLVLPAMNGVPWWFGDGLPALAGEPLHSVDPEGRIGAAIPTRRVLGCVVHASVMLSEPGVAQHVMGNGLIAGEAFGGASDRAQAVVKLLVDAGFEATLSTDIRYDIWYKLWGNLTTNPISAITGATADRLLDDELVRRFGVAVMHEAAAVGVAIGCKVTQTPEDRHAITRKLGAFKTSMLQDVEAGRPIELDGIVGAVCEIGRRVNVATPMTDALMGLTRLFARTHGLYPPG
jgi:2-dehydropantoate 2-reductase